MSKEYQSLYESMKLDYQELKRDFDASIEFTVKLEDQLADLRRDVGLRERLAGQALFGGMWQARAAQAMYDWVLAKVEAAPNVVMSTRKSGKRGPYKKTNGNSVGDKMRDAVKSKRKYTKKSKFWKKKK